MESLDIFAMFGLEWLHEKIEDRHGPYVACLVQFAAAVVLIAALIGVLILLWRWRN